MAIGTRREVIRRGEAFEAIYDEVAALEGFHPYLVRYLDDGMTADEFETAEEALEYLDEMEADAAEQAREERVDYLKADIYEATQECDDEGRLARALAILRGEA